MSAEVRNQLELVRNACRALRGRAPSVESELIQIGDVLDRMMIELGPAEVYRAQAARGLAALAGRAEAPGNYDAEAHAVAQRLRHIASNQSESASVIRAVLGVDEVHWRACQEAIEREIAESRTAVADVERGSVPQSIDVDALAAFINRAVEGEGAVRVTGTQVASEGASKKTLFITLAGNRVLPNEIVLRMDKPFNFLGTTVRDEYPALRLLHAGGAPVAATYAIEPTGDVLGQPFLLVSRLSGGMVGKSYYPPADSYRLIPSIARALARIHAVPVDAGTPIGAPRKDLRPFIEYELEKFEADWLATGASCPTIDAAFAWIRTHIGDAHGRLVIVHNDFDYHNIIIDGDEVSGVVDWEFVHVGNPAADIGYFQDSADRGGGLERFLEHYESAGGHRPSQAELDFYTVWGHVRLAVMSFQTETAYLQGKFDDIRYALYGVHFLRMPILATAEQLAKVLDRCNQGEM